MAKRRLTKTTTSHRMTELDKFYLAGTVKFPTISQHTDEQLETAIKHAEQLPHFYELLHGIDAYMERRKRRARAAKERQTARFDRVFNRFDDGFMDWRAR